LWRWCGGEDREGSLYAPPVRKGRVRMGHSVWWDCGLVGEEVVEDLDVFFWFFVGGKVAALLEDD